MTKFATQAPKGGKPQISPNLANSNSFHGKINGMGLQKEDFEAYDSDDDDYAEASNFSRKSSVKTQKAGTIDPKEKPKRGRKPKNSKNSEEPSEIKGNDLVYLCNLRLYFEKDTVSKKVKKDTAAASKIPNPSEQEKKVDPTNQNLVRANGGGPILNQNPIQNNLMASATAEPKKDVSNMPYGGLNPNMNQNMNMSTNMNMNNPGMIPTQPRMQPNFIPNANIPQQNRSLQTPEQQQGLIGNFPQFMPYNDFSTGMRPGMNAPPIYMGGYHPGFNQPPTMTHAPNNFFPNNQMPIPMNQNVKMQPSQPNQNVGIAAPNMYMNQPMQNTMQNTMQNNLSQKIQPNMNPSSTPQNMTQTVQNQPGQGQNNITQQRPQSPMIQQVIFKEF